MGAATGTVVVRRAARRSAPPLPTGDLVIPTPPSLPPPPASRWSQIAMAVPMLTGTLATALLFAGRQGGTYSYVIGGVFGISSLGMLATSFGGGVAGRQKRADLAVARTDYLRQLRALRARVRQSARAQRTALTYRHPAPRDLWSTVDSFRLWERRPSDADFAVVRVGTGRQELATALVPPAANGSDEVEPISAAALQAFLATYAVVPDLPVSVALHSFPRVHVDGSPGGRALVRAMLAQLSVFHAPPDLIVAACVGADRWADWDYLKWLPHAGHPSRRDALGATRLVTGRVADLEALLGPLVAGRPRVATAPDGASLGTANVGAFGATPGGIGADSGFATPTSFATGGGFGTRGGFGGGFGSASEGAGLGVPGVATGGFDSGSSRSGGFVPGVIPGARVGSSVGVGPLGFASTANAAAAAIGEPTIVVVLDGGDPTGSEHLLSASGLAGVCVIDLDNAAPRLPSDTAIALTVDENGVLRAGDTEVGAADALSLAAAEALARQLSPRRLIGEAGTGGRSVSAAADQASTMLDVTLADLLDIGDPAKIDLATAWAPRPPRDRLRVPIGIGADGAPVVLDLKEAAQDGMGPHGLLIGATGAGKSELLRTLVLGLAATHDSETLNFVLIDFKGGATFASLDRLPHTAAVITNLADELVLVDRMTDALNGELVRRQNLLRQAGNLASLRDYERARAAGAPLPPLPVLLIVCDEFSELLSAKPEFIDLFVAIGRLGRSLGVHLLLASQRLEEGRLRGLDTHLSYRIGLRTFSAMESRTVLGVPDAYELPRAPGHGYLKFATDPLVRFRAAYVSGPYESTSGPLDPEVETHQPWQVLPFTVAPLTVPAPRAGDALDVVGSGGARTHDEADHQAHDEPTAGMFRVGAATGPSLLDLVADALHGAGTPAHQVWLPPLAEHAHLDELLGPVGTDQSRGLTVLDPARRGRLRVPVALIDRPFDQRRDPLFLELGSAAGHVAIVGGPQAGKSTTVRTLIASLALTHTPREVTCYCLDFGGGGLGAMRDVPHVGAIAGRLAVDAVRRTVGEVATVLADRERAFESAGVESFAQLRQRRIASAQNIASAQDTATHAAATHEGAANQAAASARQGQSTPEAGAAPDAYGDVFLIVDGWSTVRAEYDDLEAVITDIATRGLSYGVHVVITAGRWTDIRPALRDLLGSRLELRLGDPTDSQTSRKIASDVPERAPGRGITTDGLHFLAASPTIAGLSTDDLVTAIRAQWRGPGAPPVRELPAIVAYEQIAVGRTDDGPVRPAALALPIGLSETDLRPVSLDFAADPHFLVFGDSGSGKSAFLRSLALSLTRRFRPEQARFLVLDYRRSMLGEIEAEHLIGYATSSGQATELMDSVAAYMADRLPGPDVTPAQLRTRSWWSGPECFVLVDDYDLIASGATNPLTPLLDYLPQARDVGLHLVIARRSGGAVRAMFEPTLARLKELATPGLIMSGDREEGVILGQVRPQPMPPGRGTLVNRRDGARLIQVAFSPPSE
ncbi:MAG TPA: type VII secretion protein EccCa [Micromonosporaceae bacterium]|nr:type VII secretion protein EccCa [Micromonosporaceae bacterium]